jgi:sialidase-1
MVYTMSATDRPSVRVRVEHQVLSRSPGAYAAFPLLERLPDGRLAAAWLMNHQGYHDHYGVADWPVVLSSDEGVTWVRCDGHDPAVPFTWPGTSPRERYDRLATVMPDGSLLAAGAVGWEVWPAARAAEAEALGLRTASHPSGASDALMVMGHRLFAQRSPDGGATWQRQEWVLPASRGALGFPRPVTLADGTMLAPLYDHAGGDPARGQNMVLRSEDGGATWRYLEMGSGPPFGEEMALVEAEPGRVLALIREPRLGFLLECWSDDAGRSWSLPTRTALYGYPPHLLRLRDGRLLCSVGVRRAPLGVQAFVGDDRGRTWDTGRPAVLRDDGETRDLGYPVSVQLRDGSILTVYYFTKDAVTHVAASRWELPW